MNLIFLFLSILFTTTSPTFTNNEGLTGTNNDGTTTVPHGGKEKFGDGDFIITNDINP